MSSPSPVIKMAYVVTLYGGAPWGFRIQGGAENDERIYISKVNPNSKAYREGIQVGDVVHLINRENTEGLSLIAAQKQIKSAGNTLELELKRGEDIHHVDNNRRLATKKTAGTQPAKQPLVTKTKQNNAQKQEEEDNMYQSSTSINMRSSQPVTDLNDGYQSDSKAPQQWQHFSSGTARFHLQPTQQQPPPPPRLSASERQARRLARRARHFEGQQQRNISKSYKPVSFGVNNNSGELNSETTSQRSSKSPSIASSGMTIQLDSLMAKVESRLKDDNVDSTDHNLNVSNVDPPSRRVNSQASSSSLKPTITTTTTSTSSTPYIPSLNVTINSKETADSGIWTPGKMSLLDQYSKELEEREKQREKDRDKQQTQQLKDAYIWSPSGDIVRKEFKPVKLQTPSKSPEKSITDQTPPPKPEESFAWKPPERPSSTPIFANGTTHIKVAENKAGLHLPPTQSPMITILQKTREGHIPKGAIYMGTKETREGDVKHKDEYYLIPGKKVVDKTTVEKKAPHYEGVGPINEQGVPIAMRSTIDEKNHHDWYKNFYKTLHKPDKPKEENPYRPTYVFPEATDPAFEEEARKWLDDDVFKRSATLPNKRTRSKSFTESFNEPRSPPWVPPSATARINVYKNQPRSIEDYEPGYSSLAEREKLKGNLHNPPVGKPGDHSQYILDDRKVPSGRLSANNSRSVSPTQQHDWYVQVQRGGDIPLSGFRKPAPERRAQSTPPIRKHHLSTSDIPSEVRSPTSTIDRRRRDEEDARRREILRQITEAEKQKKAEEEALKNEARRHSDYFMPKQKSPVPLDRFDDQMIAPPTFDKRRMPEVRGKGRAMYTFKAHGPKELSFRRDDVIYLLRQVDKNWWEAERHGRRGIVPINYIEIVRSLDEARESAFRAEGQAKLKYKFTKQNAMELSAQKGDIVTLLRRVDDNWYEARRDGQTGIIPATYLEVLRDPDMPLLTPAPSIAPSYASSIAPSTATTPGPGTPLRPLSPSWPDDPRGSPNFNSLPNHFMFPEPISPAKYHGDSHSPRATDRSPTRPSGYYNQEQRSPSRTYNKYNSLPHSASHNKDYSPHHVPQQQETNPYHRQSSNKSDYSSEQGTISRIDQYSPQHHPYNNYSSLKRHDKMNYPAGMDRRANDNGTIERERSRSEMNGVVASTAPRGGSRHASSSPRTMGHEKWFDEASYRRREQRQEPERFYEQKVAPPPQPTREKPIELYKAKYKYKPRNDDEMELREGDHIHIIEKCDDGWFVGSNSRTGHVGTFPGNYVERLRD